MKHLENEQLCGVIEIKRCSEMKGILLQVKGLQFNALSPHLLASAGMDGELAIWDLSDPQKPKQYPPLKVKFLSIPFDMHTIMHTEAAQTYTQISTVSGVRIGLPQEAGLEYSIDCSRVSGEPCA